MCARSTLLILIAGLFGSSVSLPVGAGEAPAPTAGPEVWLCAGRGVFDLLRPNAKWTLVKRHLSGIKFYIDIVNEAKPEQLQRLVRLVRERGYQVAIECGGCLEFAPLDETNGEASARIELAKLDKFYAAGGKVDFLDLDGPIRRLMHPGGRRDAQRFESMAEATDEMVDAVRAIHRAHPEIRFWHLTNFPNWGYRGDVSYHARGPHRQDYGDYDVAHRLALRKLKAAGIDLEGVTIDNPYDYLVGEHKSVNLEDPKSVNWLQRVRAYEDQARADGLAVNLIVNSERGGHRSDEEFYRETLQMVETYLAAGGRPTRWFVQTWYPHPKQIVPEDAPHTLTALTKAVIEKVRARPEAGQSAAPHAPDLPFGDFSWMHGVNYTPSYAATDVETWLKYNPKVIDRELALAKRIGLNCVRVFLQSLVYEHAPEEFRKNFADFVATADRHGLKVMPILFDSCFGVSPSLESRHMWVANPGPDRMSEADFDALDKYVRAVVTPYVGDQRIALWDVMNEPSVTVLSLTEEGKAQIWEFVKHYGRLVRKLDRTHAITVGVASSDNSPVVDLVDVLSCHSYASTREKFREALATTQRQAREAGKPWIISECCAPGWGSPYEMVFPELREFGVGRTAWELVIGKNQFAPISGLFYPDGTVRRQSSIDAVAGRAISELVEKPDRQGMPVARERAGRLAEYVRFMARNDITESTWRERNTAVAALIVHGVYNPNAADVLKKLADARAAHEAGRREVAYRGVAQLLHHAADVLTNREKARQEAEEEAEGAEKSKEAEAINEQSPAVDLSRLTPWSDPFSERPLFELVVQQWSVFAEGDAGKRSLNVRTMPTRSTDHPLSLGAD